ncbi:MAG: thioredoxin family protein [Armatimonadetes bacterium]|nr:thioredoxin family protein [Armatimonadota bacterium]
MRFATVWRYAVTILVVVIAAGCKAPVQAPESSPDPTPPTAPEAQAAVPEAQEAETDAGGTDEASAETDSADDGVKWLSDYQAALDEADKSGKLVLIDIYSDYCPPCRQMDEKTWPDPKIVAASRDFVCIKVNSDENQEVPEKYGTQFIPHVVFAKADGSVVLEDTGFKTPEELITMMEEAKSK